MASNDKAMVLVGYVKATNMRVKATVVEGIKPCCYQKPGKKIELKSQQPWTAAVSALLGLISMAQLTHALWVPT